MRHLLSCICAAGALALCLPAPASANPYAGYWWYLWPGEDNACALCFGPTQVGAWKRDCECYFAYARGEWTEAPLPPGAPPVPAHLRFGRRPRPMPYAENYGVQREQMRDDSSEHFSFNGRERAGGTEDPAPEADIPDDGGKPWVVGVAESKNGVAKLAQDLAKFAPTHRVQVYEAGDAALKDRQGKLCWLPGVTVCDAEGRQLGRLRVAPPDFDPAKVPDPSAPKTPLPLDLSKLDMNHVAPCCLGAVLLLLLWRKK